jgi:hypothetical protein
MKRIGELERKRKRQKKTPQHRGGGLKIWIPAFAGMTLWRRPFDKLRTGVPTTAKQ